MTMPNFARLGYTKLFNWQWGVLELLRSARFVLIGAGMSPSLMWEIEQVVALIPPERIMVLIPFDNEVYDSFRSCAAPYFGRMLPNWEEEDKRRRSARSSTGIRAAVLFEPDWTAFFIRFDTRGLEKECSMLLRVMWESAEASRADL